MERSVERWILACFCDFSGNEAIPNPVLRFGLAHWCGVGGVEEALGSHRYFVIPQNQLCSGFVESR